MERKENLKWSKNKAQKQTGEGGRNSVGRKETALQLEKEIKDKILDLIQTNNSEETSTTELLKYGVFKGYPEIFYEMLVKLIDEKIIKCTNKPDFDYSKIPKKDPELIFKLVD